jgi:adenine-specific DNA-methyltransferase
MTTLWTHGEIPKADIANEGGIYFPRGKKPEQLLRRIIEMSTEPGDYVLDSFLGSGTTAAVAHKMDRRWIGIEMGEHAYTHCKTRLDATIAGTDPLGITKSVAWKGGGSYRFYELALSLINQDPFGEYVINKEYDADMLAAAMALHEGFTYQPDAQLFWKQSVGNENSYLFVTTRHLNAQYLDSIKDMMEDTEYLIIACRSFDSGVDKSYPHITVKKIPQMLLSRCEFGKENYNLNIVHPPVYEDEEGD